jgi:hypothetical protein
MATSPNQGIMGLQEDYFSKGMLPPEMGLEVADGTMQNLNPQLRPAVDGLTSEISGQLADISDEELDQVIQLVQQLYDEPDNYAQNRAALIQSGELTEEDLPPEYDPEALATMLYVLRKEKQMRMGGMSNMSPGQGTMPPMAGVAPEMMQPPQGFARGGIAEAARLVAGSGRFGDTMLAHITPREAQLLRKHGGSGTINPKTGLPEFFLKKFFRKVWQAVWKPVKSFLKTSVGKIVANVALNILLPGYGSIIASGLTTAAEGGNFGDIVKSMAIAGATSFLSGTLKLPGASAPIRSPIQSQLDSLAKNLSITTDVGKEALAQGVVSAGMGLAQGQNLKDAATSGLMAAGTVQAAKFAGDVLSPKAEPRVFREPGPAAPIYENGVRVGGGNFDVDLPGEAARTPKLSSDYSAKTNVGVPAYASSSGTTSIPSTTSDGLGLKLPGAASTAIPDIDSSVSSARVMPPTDYSLSAKPLGVDPTVSSGAAFKGSSGTSTATTPYEYPSIGKSVGQIFSDDPMTGLKNTFMPEGPTTSQVINSPQYREAVNAGFTAEQAFNKVSNELTPGTLRTYGPAAAAGLGVMALSGAFTPPGQEDGPGANGPQFRGPTGADLLESNPEKYMVQGMPSVRYGSTDPNRRYTMPDVAIPTSYYDAPRYADGGEVGHYATGGAATAQVNPNYRGPMNPAPASPEPEPAYKAEYRQLSQSLTPAAREYLANNSPNGIVATAQMMRDAMAYSDQMARRSSPSQANSLFAQNPDLYTVGLSGRAGMANEGSYGGYPQFTMPDIQVPTRRFADGGEVGHYAVGGTATGTATADPNAPLDPNARATFFGMDLSALFKEALDKMNTKAAANASYKSNPEKYTADMSRRPYRQFTREDVVVEPKSKGIAGLATGGYPRKTGQISGPGTATSDSIPAMLSDGEFVMTAKAVRGLGKGSRREGAKRMYALMHQLERNAARG